MDTPRVFISYAHVDLGEVERLEQRLQESGVSVWRDQEKLYAGEKWPKALGEAISANDAVLLVWSKHAATSEYVELEWCTAIALKKTILPYRLDQTPLPSSLKAIHAIDADKPASTAQILQSLQTSTSDVDTGRAMEVIKALDDIPETEPKKVAHTAKAIFAHHRWTVAGNVYQAAGDIHVHQATPSPQKNLLEKWQTWVVVIVGVLTIASLVLDLPAKMQQALRTVSGGSDQPEVKPSRNATSGLRAEVEGVKQAVGLLTAAPQTVLGEPVLCDSLRLNLVLAHSGEPKAPISINSIAIRAKPISLSELKKGELCKIDNLSSVPYGIPDRDVFLVRIDDRSVKSRYLRDANQAVEVDSDNLLDSKISSNNNLLDSKISSRAITLKHDGDPINLYFAVQSTLSEPQEITYLISYDQSGEKTIATRRVVLWK